MSANRRGWRGALVIGAAVAACAAIYVGSRRAVAQADSRVAQFQDRAASFRTLYLPMRTSRSFLLVSADARSRTFHLRKAGMRYDGEMLFWGPGQPATTVWSARIAELWDEVLEGFPNSTFEPVVQELPTPVRARLGPAGAPYRVELPFAWTAAADLLLGLDFQGTPTGVAVVAPGTLTLLAPDDQPWTGGFDRTNVRWDVPLLPGLGGEDYIPTAPCGYAESEGHGPFIVDRCKDPTTHPEYHAVFTRYQVALDAAASATNNGQLGWAQRTTCSAAGQITSAAIDVEFPVDPTDAAYGRMVAARPHCPVRLTVGGTVTHFPDAPGVKTTAQGKFQLINRATQPPTVLLEQPFSETATGPPRRFHPRTRLYDLPAGQAASQLAIQWTGAMTIQCLAAAPGVVSGVAVVGDPPVFDWTCLPNDPPPSD